jgi:hypothetical protein
MSELRFNQTESLKELRGMCYLAAISCSTLYSNSATKLQALISMMPSLRDIEFGGIRMESMRVSEPDTPVLEPGHGDSNKPLVSSKLRVLSYEKGSYSSGSVTISKYPDGTIVLDDGKNRVVQRPFDHPARQSCQSNSVVTKPVSACSNFFRKLFGH